MLVPREMSHLTFQDLELLWHDKKENNFRTCRECKLKFLGKILKLEKFSTFRASKSLLCACLGTEVEVLPILVVRIRPEVPSRPTIR